jgi:hypothetical protein
VDILLGNGDGTFQPAVSYAAGYSPSSVAVADFNGDGTLDLAVAIGGGNGVSVLLGKGGGTFQAVPTYSTGSFTASVAVGDFNGDGIPDLAVIDNSLQGTVIILLGKGDGTFQPAGSYAIGINSANVAVGDFNRDGILDLAVANLGDGSGNGAGVSILLGKGDGTFQAAVLYRAGIAPGGVAAGDFNGDGIPDLAVADYGSLFFGANPGRVSILLGNGDGTFQAAQHYSTGVTTGFVAVGDFNRDGILDLVVANNGDYPTGQGGGVAVLLGKGDGTFQAPVNYAAGSYPSSVAVADLNGDGNPDLVVTNFYSKDLSVLLGNGDGTFPAAINYPVGPYSQSGNDVIAVAVKDFNGDGKPDLAVAFGGGVRVFLGNGDGTFQTSASSYVAGSAPWGIAVGDFKGDGFPGLAVANVINNGNNNNGLAILINDGKWAP